MSPNLSRIGRLVRGKAGWTITFFIGGLSTFLLVTAINRLMLRIVDVDTYSGGFDTKLHGVLLLLGALFVVLVWWIVAMSRCVARFQRKKRSFLLVLVSVVVGIGFLGDAGRISIDNSKDWLQTWQADRSKPMPAAQVSLSSEGGKITVRGYIGLGSYVALEQVIEKNPELKWVDIQSTDGYVIESLAMAKLIERHGLNTFSLNECSGTCTIVFAAGVQRHLGLEAKLGFLRPGKRATSYFLARGIAAYFVTATSEGSVKKMWVAETWQALAAKFATRLVYPNGVLVAL